MENLPNEILEEITQLLDLQDAKSLSQCSKQMEHCTARRIWNAPRFDDISMKKLINEVRCKEKTIKTLYLSDFYYYDEYSFSQMSSLATIYIDEDILEYLPLQYFKDRYHLHFSHISITERWEDYANILEDQNCSIYFTSPYTYLNPPCRWSLKKLTSFEKFKITKLDLDCIYFEKESCEYQQFKRLISFIKMNNPDELLLDGEKIDVCNISVVDIIVI